MWLLRLADHQSNFIGSIEILFKWIGITFREKESHYEEKEEEEEEEAEGRW